MIKEALSMTLLCLCGVAMGSPIEYWEMNDASGTDLNDLSNSGSLNSQWNFNTADATDGSGNFIVYGDTGTFTRKLPKKGTANAVSTNDVYAAPITAGAYRLDLNFSSWNVNEASGSDALSFGVNDTNGSRIARITFRASGDVQFSGFDGGFRSSSIDAVQTTAKNYSIMFDLDNDTIEYLVDGSSIYTGVMTGSDIGGFVYSKGGAWNTASTTLSIDSMGLQAIPEPATIGLVAMVGAGVLFVRRRFMMG